MKYDPNRNYLYPVMRPYADDYEDALLKTLVQAQAEPDNENLIINVEFDVSDVRIRQQVADGNARCTAMLYCRDTMYRKTLQSYAGRFDLMDSIPLRLLANNVELNPAIVTVEDVEHPTDTAHTEYGKAQVRVGKFRPLATDQTWHFQVNPKLRQTESIFNLIRDDETELQDGEFDIAVEPSDRYITIKANSATLDGFKLVRNSDETLAVSTVFLSALIEVLAWVKNTEDDDETMVANDGWVDCIRSNLQKRNISLGSRDEPGNSSLFSAAQRLLDYPFDELINHIRES